MPHLYPVTLTAPRPERFDRVQVLVRLLVLVALGMLHRTGSGLLGLVYFVLPVAAAIQISQKGGLRFLESDRRWITSVIQWVVALYGYLMFVTDRFPLESRHLPLHVSAVPSGSPGAGRALLRIVTSIPHALVLGLLGIGAALVGFVIAVVVLLTERCPPALHAFQRDVLGWLARLLAYHASLIDEYPPFALTSGGHPPPRGPEHLPFGP